MKRSFLLLLVAASALTAQSTSDQCLAGEADATTAHANAVRFHAAQYPDSVWARWKRVVDAHDELALVDSVTATFKAWSRFAGIDERTTRIMLAKLDSLREEALLVLREPKVAEAAGGAVSKRFSVVVSRDGERFQIFAPPNDTITILSADKAERRLALCGAARLAQRVADAVGDTTRQVGVARLEKRAALWDAFDANGLSMTPLELTVNSLCKFCRQSKLLNPPRFQWIVGHVAPSFLVSNVALEGSTGSAALQTEWAGFAVYSAARKSYVSVSFISVLPTAGKSSYGALVRISKLGTIGVVKPLAGTGDRYSISLSADMYRYIARGALPDIGTLKELLKTCLPDGKCKVPAK